MKKAHFQDSASKIEEKHQQEVERLNARIEELQLLFHQTKEQTKQFSADVIKDHSQEVEKIKTQTSLIISKEHELTLKMYDLEGMVEEWKLKCRAKDKQIQELSGTENVELKRQIEELKAQIRDMDGEANIMKSKIKNYDQQISATEILEESVVTKNRDL